MKNEPCVVRVDSSSQIPVIHIKGQITTFSDAAIRDAFMVIHTGEPHFIIIDFELVTYINSAGIAILVSLVTEAEKSAGKLMFSGLVAHYRRLMEIVGITDYVRCFDTVEDAIQSRGSQS